MTEREAGARSRADADREARLTTKQDPGETVLDETQQVLELREEQLVASKKEEETGTVLIRKRTEERPARLEVEALQEELEVEHVPIGRAVAEREPAREDAGGWVIPVYEEQLVVSKRLVLREEIHVRRVPNRETRLIEDTVRRDRLEIEDPEHTGRVHEIHPTDDEDKEPASPVERVVNKLLK